jgi:mRNA-degrading endonuclease RelE of RelBE toxin-antitoxin system
MVILSDDAKTVLREMDSAARKLIGGEIRKYQDGKPVNIRKLKGRIDMWRLAAGDWRIIIEARQGENEKVFEIVDVIQRKDAYRDR